MIETHTLNREEVVALVHDMEDRLARAERNVIYADKAAEAYEHQRNVLLVACEAALLHLNEAPLDYENGVTDPTGTIDEGNVVGWRTHRALEVELEAAIAATKPPAID